MEPSTHSTQGGVRIAQPVIGEARDWQRMPLVTEREAALKSLGRRRAGVGDG